jgi:hypothetical protein
MWQAKKWKERERVINRTTPDVARNAVAIVQDVLHGLYHVAVKRSGAVARGDGTWKYYSGAEARVGS